MKNKPVSERLKAWRHGKAITQREAALLLDVSRRTYEKWEGGFHAPRGIGLSALLKRIGISGR